VKGGKGTAADIPFESNKAWPRGKQPPQIAMNSRQQQRRPIFIARNIRSTADLDAGNRVVGPQSDSSRAKQDDEGTGDTEGSRPSTAKSATTKCRCHRRPHGE
jgi:hypothetical protein